MLRWQRMLPVHLAALDLRRGSGFAFAAMSCPQGEPMLKFPFTVML